MPDVTHYPIGPAILAIGDPTTALGADMTPITDTENCTFNPNQRSAFTSSAVLGGAPTADGLYTLPPNATIQAQLKEAGVQRMQLIIQGADYTAEGGGGGAATSGTLGGGDTFESIAVADVKTLVLVPASQRADGVDATDAIWFPGVLIESIENMQYGRVEEGEINNPYQVTFRAVYREEDQGSTAIPAKYRMWFKGPPENLGLTWSLPTL